MKFLKKWTIFEKLLLTISILLVSITAIIFKSDLLTPLASLVGIFTAFFLAKGKVLGQIFGLITSVLYSIVSFNNRFFGEVIIYIGVKLPMETMSIISWIKHQSEKTNTVEVNRISYKEWGGVILTSFVAFFGVYYLLKVFNTESLIVSTISVIDSLFAVYLQIRRSKYSFYFYVINDLVLIALWGIPCLSGNLMVLPMLVNPVINLANDIYGIVNWRKLEKLQAE